MKKWLSILSRPAFESANPDKRARAVASDNSEELQVRLPDLARHDNDAKVRMAALRRIDDLSLLADRARLDSRAEVRDLARSRLRQFMLDPATDLHQRQRQLRVLEDDELLEEIARQGEPTDLRRAALERITRPGLLLERCQKDRDPTLRLELLERIEDPAALERLAESARKSDKKLARAAREKLAGLRLAQGDLGATREQAAAICRRLEAWLHALPAELGDRLAEAERQWASLSGQVDVGNQQRFLGLLQTLRHMQSATERPATVLVAASQALAGDAAAPDPIESPEPTPAPEPQAQSPAEPPLPYSAFERYVASVRSGPAPDGAALAAIRQRLRGEFASAMDASDQAKPRSELLAWLDQESARLAEIEQALKQAIQDWHSRLEGFAAAVESGQIQQARQADAHLQAVRLDQKTLPAAAIRRLHEVEQAFAKLLRWQRWSNDNQRKRLCAEIESSIGSGEHPDAVLSRIKAAQAEWQRLAEMEGEPISGPGPNRLDSRFRALCARAIAPARPYLQKRSALRAEKESELASRITALEQSLHPDAPDSDAFASARELRELWPLLEPLSGRERNRLGERLRQLKATIDARTEQSRESARAAKQGFIAKLRRQLSGLDPAAAVALAKDASLRWKALSRADRKSEQVLWDEFRGLIDPLFEGARAEQDQREARASADRQQAEEILAGLAEQLTAAKDPDRLDTESKRLLQRWQALGPTGRNEQRRLDQMRGEIESHHAALVHSQTQAARASALDLFWRLRTAGAAEQASLRAEIESAAIAGAERTALLGHWRALSSEQPTEPNALAERLALLAINAEILAGIDSPPEAAPRRRELQLRRLAGKLQGSEVSVIESARPLWLEWLSLAGECADRAAFDQRIANALALLTF